MDGWREMFPPCVCCRSLAICVLKLWIGQEADDRTRSKLLGMDCREMPEGD